MKKIPTKIKILETANRLFYTQGYRATGINQIIKEADVAKASFYQHFPSKENLCEEYLAQRHLTSHKRQQKFITTGNTPVERICNLFENIRQNTISNNFNGCPFLNIAAEIYEHDSKIRQAVTQHKSKLIALIRAETKGFNDPDTLAEMVYLIYEGANIAVRNYRKIWPVDRAIQLTRKLLEMSS